MIIKHIIISVNGYISFKIRRGSDVKNIWITPSIATALPVLHAKMPVLRYFHPINIKKTITKYIIPLRIIMICSTFLLNENGDGPIYFIYHHAPPLYHTGVKGM